MGDPVSALDSSCMHITQTVVKKSWANFKGHNFVESDDGEKRNEDCSSDVALDHEKCPTAKTFITVFIPKEFLSRNCELCIR